MSNEKSKGNAIRKIIMIVALLVAAGCIAFIVYKQIKGKAEDKVNDNIRESVASETTAEVVDIDDDKKKEFTFIDFDYESFKAESPDGIGWIEVPAVGISYPLVQGSDNDFYLDHNYKGDFAWSGAIFLDYKCKPGDKRSIISGHHMNDGSMFSGLLEYDSEDFYKQQAENDNNYFFIYYEKEIQVYEIFNISDVTFDEHPKAYSIIHSGDEAIKEFLDEMDSVKLYDTGVEASTSDDIVTLFTCQEDSASKVRHMVSGKLISTINR